MLRSGSLFNVGNYRGALREEGGVRSCFYHRCRGTGKKRRKEKQPLFFFPSLSSGACKSREGGKARFFFPLPSAEGGGVKGKRGSNARCPSTTIAPDFQKEEKGDVCGHPFQSRGWRGGGDKGRSSFFVIFLERKKGRCWGKDKGGGKDCAAISFLYSKEGGEIDSVNFQI